MKLLVSARRTSVFTIDSELPTLIANNVIKSWPFWRNSWRLESPKELVVTTLGRQHTIPTLAQNDLATPGTAPLDQIVQRGPTRPVRVTNPLLDRAPH